MPPLRGIGVDLIAVSRIERLVQRRGFVPRWFTLEEAARCARRPAPAAEFAALLASKEAAWKALALPWSDGVPWGSLEVSGDRVELRGKVAQLASQAGVDWISVTSCASGGIVIATAWAWLA